MVAWSTWCNWNEVRQGKPSQEGGAILHKARFLLNEFQTPNFSITLPVAQACVQWEAPHPPWYKLKVDRAVFSSSQTAGVGAVIRDAEGRVTKTLSKHLLLPLGPLEAEAKALEEGDLFCLGMQVNLK